MSEAPLSFRNAQQGTLSSELAWDILIVDDDQDVHSVTELVMHGVTILGRPLRFLHAYSAAQAREVLVGNPDIAVILLDVVMESENAGLNLVQAVREELGIKATRIILRTGQPGYAPEYEAIRDYDINDYRTKSELSYARLLTSLTSAIRSFIQIRTISDGADSLEHIIESAPELLAKGSFKEFEDSLLLLLGRLLKAKTDALLVHLPGYVEEEGRDEVPRVRGGFGKWKDIERISLDHDLGRLETMVDRGLMELAHLAMEHRNHEFGPFSFVLYFFGMEYGDLLLLVSQEDLLDKDRRRLLEVFSVAASMAYQNMNLVTKLRSLAFQDTLTGLRNRTGLIQDLAALREENDRGLSLALIDIEGFSELNEVLGHRYGDDLLVAVAERTVSDFHGSVIRARVGSDAFVLVGTHGEVNPDTVARLFSEPFRVQNKPMYLRMVAGFVRLDEVGGDGADLLKDAYLAVKKAKTEKQTRYAYYDPRAEIDNRKRVDLLQKLQESLRDGSLSLHYQPQIRLGDGATTGFEALLRWRQTDGTYIPPGLFIPLAEQSGLIVEIGNWLIREALGQIRKWHKAGHTGLRMAINISVRQFYDPGFIPFLLDCVRTNGVPTAAIELEVTESMAMNAIDEVVDMLGKLKQEGFFIALDDFGTGFSSLSYLHKLPIDRIKIDQSFVRTIHTEEKHRSIAQTIVRLGQSLGLNLIAEGVEEEDQGKVLQQLGCTEAQGYLYSRPMDTEASTAWIASLDTRTR